jgi:hypothetical protein
MGLLVSGLWSPSGDRDARVRSRFRHRAVTPGTAPQRSCVEPAMCPRRRPVRGAPCVGAVECESSTTICSAIRRRRRARVAGRPWHCRPPCGPCPKTRALLLASQHDLSDEKLAWALDDRAGFRQFCGFAAHEPTPERTAFARFRRELVRCTLHGVRVGSVARHLEAKGVVVRNRHAGERDADPIRQHPRRRRGPLGGASAASASAMPHGRMRSPWSGLTAVSQRRRRPALAAAPTRADRTIPPSISARVIADAESTSACAGFQAGKAPAPTRRSAGAS